MTSAIKHLFKGMGIIILVMIVLILMVIVVLSIPGLFFPEEKQYGSITLHSEETIGPEADSIMDEVFLRLQEVPIYDPAKRYNLCLCRTQKKFSFFANLTIRANRIMGFYLLGSAYVNEDYINELGMKTRGQPRYLTREGSVVHVATHELMHGYMEKAFGSFAVRALPEWKTEGYCEYGVNQFVAPQDSGYSIPERIDIFLDDDRWNPAAQVHRPHYLWGLMMEYLVNVMGLNFEQLMADNVTYDQTYGEMMEWRKSISR